MYRNISLVITLLCFSLYGSAQQSGGNKKVKEQNRHTTAVSYKETGAILPPLNFYRRDGVYITNNDLKLHKPVIIMLFNPTCEHCEQQTRLFGEHLELFSETNLMLMAADKMGPYLGYFVSATHADNYPALQIGLDSSNYIQHTFRYEGLPQINIYNKERKLIKVFSGFTPADSLKQYIH